MRCCLVSQNLIVKRLREATALTAVCTIALQPVAAYALPAGGVVNAGSAKIDNSVAYTTTINQSSSRAVIDWNSFNVSNGESVNFVQPSSSAIALNRIHDANPSTIDGSLTANGNVWLVNPNGVMFGKNAQVNVGGVVATSSDITDSNFMSGVYDFFAGSNPNATIGNAGNIVADNGLVALVGPNVINNGVIEATLGKVQLGSGDSFTLDLYGDGLINLQASPAITQQIVSNSGTITANGGKVLLTTAAAAQSVDSLINMDGLIQADTVGTQNGEIVLSAQGANANLTDSGKIYANGGADGNGGSVKLWSANNTSFTGIIGAKGGKLSGNGGTVETSGKNLSVTGKVVTTAPHGLTGNWLLDPSAIDILTGGSSSSLTGATIAPTYLANQLNGTNITLTADTSITVSNAIDASGNGSVGNLIFDAPTDYLNAPITLKTGSTLSGTATTVNVGSGGLVQNGVDVAADAATVNLADATYALANEITIAKNLTLNGNGAILDGQNATRVMEINGSTATLNDLTFENGNGAGANDNGAGGALLIYSPYATNNVTINNSSFTNNSASSNGTAIWSDSQFTYNTLTINNSTISGNTSGNQGAIAISGYSGHAVTTINNSTISNNTDVGPAVWNDADNGSAVMTINNTIISNNVASGGNGGGIGNSVNGGSAIMTINNSTIENNSSVTGGGINNNANLTINDSTISGNAASTGGGIYSSKSLIINNSTISGNTAGNNGGGIYNDGYDGNVALTINTSTISGNSATNGAGICIDGSNGGASTATINDSTISGNSAGTAYGNSGGAILNDGNSGGNAALTINDSTITGNSAYSSGGISNEGYAGVAPLTISNSTISGNSAPGGGGGISNGAGGGGNATLTIVDSILAGNTNGSGTESDYSSGGGDTLASDGYNLYGQNGNAGGFVPNNTPAAADIPLNGNISTVLNTTLANNGGPTETLALVSGSPAIAAGGANTGGYEIDQRGMARALSGQISIGAYEYNSPGNPFVVTSTADPSSLTLGTLRTALDYSNHNPSMDPTITFDPTDFATPQVILLNQGELLISSSLTLTGPTAGVTLNAANNSRVMEIDGSSDGINVTLNKLTLENGNGVGTNYSGAGGGLLIYTEGANHATVNISDSTVSGNSSADGGGGIYNDARGGNSTLNISNSTISGNSATGGPGYGEGGGIFNDGYLGGATLTINNSTISGNSASQTGGGIWNQGNTTVAVGSTILAGNTVSGNESNYLTGYGGSASTSLGHNLFGQNGNAGGFTGDGTTDILLGGNINTVLTPLGNYGGPTETMALVVGSPAYLAGGAAGSVTTDQRGDARGSTISIGAYDYVPTSLVVNSAADTSKDIIGGSTTTLRDGLYYSNVGAISDPTITFDPTVFATPQTITLTQGELTIDSSLTLNGTNAGVFLDANNASRVMEIDGTSGGITVNLNKLTLENGDGTGANRNNWGGALLVYAESGNQATVDISDSTISNNTTSGNGGGIVNDGIISGNATMTITNSTIANNSAGQGGGINNNGEYGGNATMTINDSTISGNSAAAGGGGIYNDGQISGGSAILTIGDTILAGNTTSGSESEYLTYSGSTLISNGYNLYGQNGNAGGFTPAAHDILLAGNIDTVLGALGNYGGPTQTMALALGSPAIDAGAPAAINSLDQRGFIRGYADAGTGSASDIGAYEAAIINVSADNKEITYGNALPSVTYTLNSGPAGHLNGGAVALITNETNAGTYAGDIGIGSLALTSNAYLLDFTAGQLKIDTRTVTVDPTARQSKMYGATDPTLAYTTAAADANTGLVNSDTLSGNINYSGAGQYTNVGTYSTTLGNLSNSNYNIVLEGGAPTFAITPHTLTITADNQSKMVGDSFTFTGTEFTSSGLQNGQTIGSVTLTSAGADASASAAGSPYSIVPSNATGGTFTPSNYSIGYVAGLFTVNAPAVSNTVPPIPSTVTEIITGNSAANYNGSSGSASDDVSQFFGLPANDNGGGSDKGARLTICDDPKDGRSCFALF